MVNKTISVTNETGCIYHVKVKTFNEIEIRGVYRIHKYSGDLGMGPGGCWSGLEGAFPMREIVAIRVLKGK